MTVRCDLQERSAVVHAKISDEMEKAFRVSLRELPNIIVGIPMSAFGFLIALMINEAIADNHERQQFCSMVAAIHAEAKYNLDVENRSMRLLQFGTGGIILSEYDKSISTSLLSNPIFEKRATSRLISAIESYERLLSLNNNYRSTETELTLYPGHSQYSAAYVAKIWSTHDTQTNEVITTILTLTTTNNQPQHGACSNT